MMNLPVQGAEVLVVDDNRLNREMLSRRLQRKGFLVSEAADGHQALAMLEDQRFDVAIFDIMMPGISGVEALVEVRKRLSPAELPVIMATAKAQSEDIVEALRAGANDYVTKPIDFPVLLARVVTQLNLKRLYKLKDEFLSIASHDLKNPLFVIVCQAYLVQMKVPVGAPMTQEAAEMIQKIADHARTMQNLIADFLDFQAAEDGQLRLNVGPMDLNEIARRVLENQRGYTDQKGISLEFHPAADLPPVHADASRIEQVVQNLISNALKFTPKGGMVEVLTRPVDGVVRFEVSDSGPGLSEEDLQKVFVKPGKLSTTPTGGEKSSGIGLAICKKMVDLHSGRIGVHNREPNGATFWFELDRNGVVPQHDVTPSAIDLTPSHEGQV